MKIAMLARNPNLYSHQRLKSRRRRRGATGSTSSIPAVLHEHRLAAAEVYYNGESLKGYDAVIPRIGASVTFYGMAVLRQFEMMGVYPSTKASPSAARATSCGPCSFWRATGSACR
jgi:ribosomal protein S6--L-glutamate ligase